MTDINLTGLDGTNPLGFLAALGALRVADEHGLEPTLRWELRDAWRPIVQVHGGIDELVEVLQRDVESWQAGADELELGYEKTTKKGTAVVYELKPPPEQFQAFARRAVDRALEGDRRWADHVAAYAAAHGPLGLDQKGEASKPTALHFSAGNQLFLAAVRQLCAGLEPEDLREALLGPWRYERPLPVLGWDVLAGERDYALRARDPSGDKKLGVPAADWLGFRALPFFPVVLRDGAAATTGFEGRGKRYTFHWVLWDSPVSMDVARSIVAARWDRISLEERSARGVVVALAARVRRTDQGGYGSFAAASVE